MSSIRHLTIEEIYNRLDRDAHIKTLEMLLGAEWISPMANYTGYFKRKDENGDDQFFNYHGEEMRTPWG